MKVSRVVPVASLLLAGVVVLAGGCRKTGDVPQASDAAATHAEQAAPAAAEPAPVSLEDVVEHDPRYVIGISYPPGAAAHPGLARALHDYAQSARGELLAAVEGLDAPPSAPYELSLGFRTTVDTPQVIAVAADGSLYTGGAHGQPLVARFVWLPSQGKALQAADLVPTAAGWEAISDYVSEKLGAAAHTRAADETLTPADRKRLVSVALKMIAEGTEPKAENFSQFEPIQSADGRLSGLRFVFAPYQVGPYADGIQEVEVPASVLLPYVAEPYRELFTR
jgi:hypothetical protein